MRPEVSARDRHVFDVEEHGLHRGAPLEPCLMVIFDAAGDLARRELVPSLFELHRKQLLPERFAVIGFSQGRWESTTFRDEMRRAVEQSCGGAQDWQAFARRLSFVNGDAMSAPHEAYAALAAEIDRVQSVFAIPGNIMFHLAVPAALFSTIVDRLGASGLAASPHGWRRLVVEKPFGKNRASAQGLDRQLQAVFAEDQIYRIDHFLGKETVQNMARLPLRQPESSGWARHPAGAGVRRCPDVGEHGDCRRERTVAAARPTLEGAQAFLRRARQLVVAERDFQPHDRSTTTMPPASAPPTAWPWL